MYLFLYINSKCLYQVFPSIIYFCHVNMSLSQISESVHNSVKQYKVKGNVNIFIFFSQVQVFILAFFNVVRVEGWWEQKVANLSVSALTSSKGYLSNLKGDYLNSLAI